MTTTYVLTGLLVLVSGFLGSARVLAVSAMRERALMSASPSTSTGCSASSSWPRRRGC